MKKDWIDFIKNCIAVALLLGSCRCFGVVLSSEKDFAVTDYGAVEGRLCTASFAAAVSACERAGGGRIVVPSGRWLTGAIRLGSNCCLHLEQGATLEFTDDPQAYLPAVRTAWEDRKSTRLNSSHGY